MERDFDRDDIYQWTVDMEKRIKALEVAVKGQEKARGEEGAPDYRKQIAALRNDVNDLKDPMSRRMDNADITRRIDNGIRIELAKHGIGRGAPEGVADTGGGEGSDRSLGESLGTPRDPAPSQQRLDTPES